MLPLGAFLGELHALCVVLWMHFSGMKPIMLTRLSRETWCQQIQNHWTLGSL